MKQVTLWCFRYTFGEIRLKTMQWKCNWARDSNLKYWECPKDVTLWTPFRNILRKSTGRYYTNKNKQQLTFQYFTQYIWWSKIENDRTVMCFIIYFQIGILRTSQRRHFRTLLGRLLDASPQFMRNWMNLIVFAYW